MIESLPESTNGYSRIDKEIDKNKIKLTFFSSLYSLEKKMMKLPNQLSDEDSK